MDRYTPSSDAYYDSAEIEVLEHYEINRERHKDERDGIQKKTFTKWVNKHLAKSNIDSLSANQLERGPIGGFIGRAFTFVYEGEDDVEGQNWAHSAI
ncbi:hypothetical protein Aduo_001857 [Ancylostoma duodenale]